MALLRAAFISISLVFVILFLNGCATQQDSYFQTAQNDYARKHYTDAFQELNIGVRRKDPKAMYAMGYMYYYGLGVAKDRDLGRNLIRQAANANYPSAVTAMQLITERRSAQHTPFEKLSQQKRHKLAENKAAITRDHYA